jgi:simple sugar transport system permease protein
MFSTHNNKKRSAFRSSHEFFLLMIIIGFFVLLTALTQGRFADPENLSDMIASYSSMGVMAVGVLIVIISGGIDISFMAVATVAQYLTALFMIHAGGNMFLSFAIAILIGFGLGSVNAVLVNKLRAPAIIITIATMNAFYGILMWLSNGKWLYNLPPWFSQKTPATSLLLPIVTFAAVIAFTWWMLRYTRIGRRIFAVGGNLEAAGRVGVDILKTQWFIYAFMGITAGLGSVIHMYSVQNIAPNALLGREMEVLSMVVLGGAVLTGGKGSVLGTVLGVLFMAMLGNGLVLLGVSSYWNSLLMGVVILVSFCITGMRTTGKKHGNTGKEARNEA